MCHSRQEAGRQYLFTQTKSELGHKRKGSWQADVFRFTPGSRRSNGQSLRSRLGHIRTHAPHKIIGRIERGFGSVSV